MCSGGAGVIAETMNAVAKLMIMPTKPIPSGDIPRKYCAGVPSKNWK